MTIASMIVQPAPACAGQVAAELTVLDGVTVHSITPSQQIIVVIEALSLQGVSDIARNIESRPGVSGAYPAYVNDEA